MAKKLTVKDAGGKTVQYGFGAAIYGWLLEQLLATDGKEYCDNGNGRKGLATKVQFDQETGVRVAQWWADLVKGGYATNTGRKTDDAQAAFKAGTVAIHLESTGAMRGYVEAAKGKFTVLTAPYPKVDSSSTGGPIIGGASLWIDGVGHSAKEKRAAWEFVKFAAEPRRSRPSGTPAPGTCRSTPRRWTSRSTRTGWRSTRSSGPPWTSCTRCRRRSRRPAAC